MPSIPTRRVLLVALAAIGVSATAQQTERGTPPAGPSGNTPEASLRVKQEEAAPRAVPDSATMLRQVANDAKAMVLTPADQINPFTGNPAAFEEGARELKLQQQRTRILEQRLQQARALSEIGKLSVEPSVPSPGGFIAHAPAITPGAGFFASVGIHGPSSAIAPSAPHGATAQSPSSAPSTRPIRKPAARPAAPPPAASVPAAPVTPSLVGIATIDGKRYAIFERDGRPSIVPENGRGEGVEVGRIRGSEVQVNGQSRQLRVGEQEVQIGPVQVEPPVQRPTSSAGAIPGASDPVLDMQALRLPAVPARPLSGPQAFAPGAATLGVAR